MIDTEEHKILLTPKYFDWLDHSLLVVQFIPVIVYIAKLASYVAMMS